MASESDSQESGFRDDGGNPEWMRLFRSLDMTKLPKPFMAPWPIGTVSQKNFERAVGARIASMIAVLERSPTQEEVDALSYHTAYSYRAASYGRPLGVVAGAFRAWDTRRSFKFPFLKPPAGFLPDRVEINGRTLLSGSLARVFWHTARTSAYILFAGAVGQTLFASFAVSRGAVAELRDPRLQDFVNVIRQKAQKSMSRPPRDQNEYAEERRRQDASGNGNDNATNMGRRHPRAVGGADDTGMRQNADMVYDEAAFKKESDDAEKRNQVENSDRISSAPFEESIRRPGPAPTRSWSRSPKSSPAESSNQTDFFGNDDDGASPIARESMAASGNKTSSSWAKIRQSAASQTQAGADPDQRARYPRPREQDDGFPGSREEAKRQLDRDAAQKEFDRLLEKERHVDQGENESKKW